jgi:lipid-binding SYLF domain-containing protein
MKKNIMSMITAVAAACTLSAPAFAEITSQKLMKRSEKAAQAISEIAQAEDKTIPLSLLERATCIVTIPDMIRGGFVFGAKYGQGLASCRVGGTWGAPSYVSIKGGNWGLQIGVQAVDLILVFTRSNALNKLSSANFTLGAGASIAAGPVGRHAQVGTDYHLNSEIYSYSRTRGLFAGLTLEGAVLQPNISDNAQVYPKTFAPANILTMPGRTAPSSLRSYVKALDTYAR